ncbi:TetR/AcrR family transcriptional regulator [Bradyrhizobium sp. dw_411]|uniref:TetR/AcrR family transcriptional regulator n=1 Tax=Bradyrhizobium sp. dw_411 TaxID=2720082 RepID=UPI001BCF003B|nr:TetR/AcrR family transcriptional regulator [Bradyrhizobium sp. dw_411]
MRVPLKKSQPQEPKQLGRPRSETSRIAILEATMALLDKTSVRDITIEAIAREAGVGKVTIYRWWPTKIHLVVDAFMETMLPQTPFPESDAKFGAFAHHLAVLVKKYRGKYGRIVGEIIAEGQFDRDALTYFREALLTQRRAAARDIVDNAKTRGEIDNEIETDILVDALYGPIYYRLLLGHQPLDADFIAGLEKLTERLAVPPLRKANPAVKRGR